MGTALDGISFSLDYGITPSSPAALDTILRLPVQIRSFVSMIPYHRNCGSYSHASI